MAIQLILLAVNKVSITGNLTQYGHKIWNWRHNEYNSRLLHYIEGAMDIYKGTQIYRHQNTTNHWTRVSTNQPTEINGNICSVREVALAVVEITSTSKRPRSQEMPTYFMDVLLELGSTLLWDYLRLVGEDNWIE